MAHGGGGRQRHRHGRGPVAGHAAHCNSHARALPPRVSGLKQSVALREMSGVTALTPFTIQEHMLDPSTQKLTRVVVQNVAGDKSLTQTIACDSIFVMIGLMPNMAFLTPQQADVGSASSSTRPIVVELDEEGLVVLQQPPGSSSSLAVTTSSVPGIFAVGEVTDKMHKQAIMAAAAGAQATIDAEWWLRQPPPQGAVNLRQ